MNKDIIHVTLFSAKHNNERGKSTCALKLSDLSLNCLEILSESVMAAGSRRNFALDLNDIIAFPDAGHMPVFPPAEQESWIILLEVRLLSMSHLLARTNLPFLDN